MKFGSMLLKRTDYVDSGGGDDDDDNDIDNDNGNTNTKLIDLTRFVFFFICLQ